MVVVLIVVEDLEVENNRNILDYQSYHHLKHQNKRIQEKKSQQQRHPNNNDMEAQITHLVIE